MKRIETSGQQGIRGDRRIKAGDIRSMIGFVSPGGWDDDGNVVNLCLVTLQGKHYFLRAENQNLNLFNYLKKSVVVEGVLINDNGISSISVLKISEAREPSE